MQKQLIIPIDATRTSTHGRLCKLFRRTDPCTFKVFKTLQPIIKKKKKLLEICWWLLHNIILKEIIS